MILLYLMCVWEFIWKTIVLLGTSFPALSVQVTPGSREHWPSKAQSSPGQTLLLNLKDNIKWREDNQNAESKHIIGAGNLTLSLGKVRKLNFSAIMFRSPGQAQVTPDEVTCKDLDHSSLCCVPGRARMHSLPPILPLLLSTNSASVPAHPS